MALVESGIGDVPVTARPGNLGKPRGLAEESKPDGCSDCKLTELQTTSNTKVDSETLSLIFLLVVIFFMICIFLFALRSACPLRAPKSNYSNL